MNDFVLILGGENTPVNKTPFCQQGLARGRAPPFEPPAARRIHKVYYMLNTGDGTAQKI